MACTPGSRALIGRAAGCSGAVSCLPETKSRPVEQAGFLHIFLRVFPGKWAFHSHG